MSFDPTDRRTVLSILGCYAAGLLVGLGLSEAWVHVAGLIGVR